ncbi:MAG: hypothetical protein J7L73_02430 [Anaerolineales bacterium]|nr:hypothetical protein [Anaerolineales bacterium]
MRTPSGKDCKFFYGDYFRGRNKEECRLFLGTQYEYQWNANLCLTCPVPDILLANACEHMILTGKIVKPFFILKARVEISAFCNKTKQVVDKPYIGCGECHSLPSIFNKANDDSYNTD